MRIAILSHKNLIEAKCTLTGNIKRAIERSGNDIEVLRVDLSRVEVEFDEGNLSFHCEGQNILEYDVFFIRLTVSLQGELSFLIAKTLKDLGKIVINESHAGFGTRSDKLSFLGVANELGIKHPKTFFVGDYSGLKNASKKVKFPFIVKDYLGWQGSTVEKIETENDLVNFEKNFPENGVLVQEYFPIESDIRVLVVGDKAIGAMERFSTSDDFRTNISLGGTAKKIEMTKEMKEISERIARETKNSILGVDFIRHNGELYVLEIEDCPGIAGFMKYVGIKPADNLIRYIIEQYESKNR